MSSVSRSPLWGKQVEIKSGSSSRVYIVSEKLDNGRPTGTYGCSCPGWRGYRNCKHLRSMGLKSCEAPITPRPRGAGKFALAFAGAVYPHYDTRNGFGSAEEWFALAEEMARGRKRYVRPARQTPSMAADMKLLGLTAMPDEPRGLVLAYRRQAMKLHPDRVHPADETHRRLHPKCPECEAAIGAFTSLQMAYERLLKRYPKA